MEEIISTLDTKFIINSIENTEEIMQDDIDMCASLGLYEVLDVIISKKDLTDLCISDPFIRYDYNCYKREKLFFSTMMKDLDNLKSKLNQLIHS